MRFRHRDGTTIHVAYCTNVHPAEELDGVLAQLERYAVAVRGRLGRARLGVGLWLAAPLAHRLDQHPEALPRLRAALRDRALEVVTLNGFPYRAFQAPVVKHAVYEPSWTDPRRLAYSLALARVLAALLPDDATEGSISTLPLGWRTGWTERDSDAARTALAKLASELDALERTTGKRVRVALEPEPGCIVETTAQAATALRGVDPKRIGVCLDACHLAVQFEAPDEALATLDRAGVAVVKAQASAAVRAPAGTGQDLARFHEPRFLHQARAATAQGVAGVDDLDEALAGGLPREREWRVHFHVPVHLDDGGATSTQPELRALLDALVGGATPRTRHVELETYTWDVLPDGMRPAGDGALVDGLARELDWLARELTALGLEEVA